MFVLAEAEGVHLWPQDGNVHYRSPGPIGAELRGRIVANKRALLALLACWDGAEALRLMREVDEAVERYGVSGRDRVIVQCVDRGDAAHSRHDMAGVRAACALIHDRVRKLSSGPTPEPGRGH